MARTSGPHGGMLACFSDHLCIYIVCNLAISIFGRISVTEGRLYRVTELWALYMCTVGNNNNR